MLLLNNICCSSQSLGAIALKRKSNDEEFIKAQCACIDDGATLKYCELIN